MTISPEAKEAARIECLAFQHPDIYDTHELGHYVQLAINSATAPLESKINELELRLKLRQEHVTTHSDRCHLWHIECAVRRLEEAMKEIERLRGEVEKAYWEAYSTDGDAQVPFNHSRARRVAEGKE